MPGFEFLAGGALLLTLPILLQGSPLAPFLAVLRPAGLGLLGLGALLLLVERFFGSASSAVPVGERDRSARRARNNSPIGAREPARTDIGARVAAGVSEPGESASFPAPQGVASLSHSLLRQIEWRRFEALVEALYSMAGFETRSQSHGPDGGVDVWLYARSQPDTPVGIVQCKHWTGKQIGVDKVRELKGVMASLGLTRAQFATTSIFTPDAVQFAARNGINLLDAPALLLLIEKRSAQEQAALLAVATEGEYWRPTCVNCGIKLVERTPLNGGKRFWGCPSYPRCRTTMQMRAA